MRRRRRGISDGRGFGQRDASKKKCEDGGGERHGGALVEFLLVSFSLPTSEGCVKSLRLGSEGNSGPPDHAQLCHFHLWRCVHTTTIHGVRIRVRTYVRASSLSLSTSLSVPWGEVVVVGIAPALSATQEKPILSLSLSLLSTRTNILLPGGGGERERCIVSGRGHPYTRSTTAALPKQQESSSI